LHCTPAVWSVTKRASTREPAWVKGVLISVALSFFAVFLLLPLGTVFAEGLRKGWGAYLAALINRDAWDAIKLTLITAAIAVPLNLVFGVAAAWSIAKFEFPGKRLLITFIDLPFSVSPVISGLIYRVAVRCPGLVRSVALGARHPDYLRRAGDRAGDHFRDLPFRRPRTDSADGSAGQRGRGSGRRPRRLWLAGLLVYHAYPTSSGGCCTG
jgi:hypothetical protein